MPEIWVFNHGNRFLMIRIKIIINENLTLTEETRSSSVESVSVLPTICWCECYFMIQYSISNNFSVFCKNSNLENESIKKPQSHLTWHPVRLRENVDDIQLIYEWKLNLVIMGGSSSRKRVLYNFAFFLLFRHNFLDRNIWIWNINFKKLKFSRLCDQTCLVWWSQKWDTDSH